MNKFVAYLTTDRSCLDGDFLDLTVLEIEESGAGVSTESSFYGVTSIRQNHEGDDRDELAMDEAHDMLKAAGWRITGEWEYTGNSIDVVVEPD